MRARLFDQAANIKEPTDAIPLLTKILVCMHKKGQAQQSIDNIVNEGQRDLLPLIRMLLIIERDTHFEHSVSIIEIIRSWLRNKTSIEASTALASTYLFYAGNPLPEAFIKYGDTVGSHFSASWVHLGNSYLETLTVAKRNNEIIALIDAELKQKHEPNCSSKLSC